MRRLLANAALTAGSLLGTAAVAEVSLRIAGYRFSAVAFFPPGSAQDYRSYHVSAVDPRVSPTEPVTLFDPELLWRPNPAASFQISDQGLRGPHVPWPRPADHVLALALGDSNTLGPLHEADHWPGHLQALADLNRGRRRVQVANAGVYGYSSLQGLRRFRQLLHLRPQVAYWCFGANDGHRSGLSDAAWAEQARRLRWLAESRLALFVAGRLWRREAGPDRVPRVSTEEYRRNLEEFLTLAEAQGVRPVLLTRPYLGASDTPGHWLTDAPAYNAITREVAARRGVDCVDAHAEFRDDPASFADESHFNRRGHQRLARILARHLAAVGVVEGSRAYADAVDFGAAPDHRPELRRGFWRREPWAGTGGGRWTGAEAEAVLERRASEAGLHLDVTVAHPSGRACGRVEVNRRRIEPFCWPNGRVSRILDITAVRDRFLEVTLRVDDPFVPSARGGGDRSDRRHLGLFVHAIALVNR